MEINGPHVGVLGDVSKLPFGDESFDAAICTHVLEHIIDDRGALAEIYRVLKPGGSAVISAPIRLDQLTDEDVSINDPEERARRFGEPGHFRWYGKDFFDRLGMAGFSISFDPSTDVPDDVKMLHGLRDDENIFHCKKPMVIVPQSLAEG